VTRAPADDNILCNRYIIESFPRNQHRPVLLHYGICVPLTESIEKRRWNFSSVDWESFAADIDHVVRFILACLDSYERFSNAIRAASKRHVPRGFRKGVRRTFQAGIRIMKIFTKNMTEPLQIVY
jgi:hypothetical protein